MFYSVSKKCLYFLSFRQKVRILQVTKIQRVHGFCGLKTEAAHNTQLCHNAAGNPNFIIILSLTSSSDCNNFTPLSTQKLKDFLTAVLASLLFNDYFFVCSFLFFLFLPCFFYLNTTETHANTHSYFKGLYFFPCSCLSGPPSHNPCFKLFWVWVYYGAHECVCQCLYNVGGGVFSFFVPQNTVSDCGNKFFYFFLSRVKFGNRANGATGIWEKILIVLHSLWHALT